ncbi:Vps51/Vps67-domain-containing protein [Chaetomium fimeti]|uniref:Vacuolar protein sorting-associated protein 51 homolog n=1 Tax=Chaetomium fimeti TaxID=1854472 RepID=A0AAE0H6P9_9PEZI|nr:Vps51/Vps67-domain-containing protein [Chaetomium fimeti]
MSTIASPRDRPGPFPRRTNSSITPTSSSRPSLDAPASASSSPNPNTSSSSTTTATTATAQPKRTNRAALREYYNLRNNTTTTTSSNKPLPSPPTVEITDHLGDPIINNPPTNTTTGVVENPPSELDSPTFNAPAYTTHLLQTASLADLLRTHARVLGEMRALDAERKALVYDNYSKLIAATDTIRRMRAARTPGTPGEVVLLEGAGGGGGGGGGNADRGGGGGAGATGLVGGGTLEGVVDGIYEVAVGLREELRREVDAAAAGEQKGTDGDARRERTRELAKEVVKVPERVRRLVAEGRVEEAKEEWDRPRRLLVRWKELGVGGEEVGGLIEEGDAALKGPGGGEGGEGASATA